MIDESLQENAIFPHFGIDLSDAKDAARVRSSLQQYSKSTKVQQYRFFLSATFVVFTKKKEMYFVYFIYLFYLFYLFCNFVILFVLSSFFILCPFSAAWLLDIVCCVHRIPNFIIFVQHRKTCMFAGTPSSKATLKRRRESHLRR